MIVRTLVQVLSSLIYPKFIEFVLKVTLKRREWPLRLIGTSLPLSHRILKLAVVIVSANPGEKVTLREKLILGGMLPFSGVNPKNC